MARSAKHAVKLSGGPYDGKSLFLSDDATSTITFGLQGFYGRYEGTCGSLHWHAMGVTEPRRGKAAKAQTVDEIMRGR